MGKIYVNGKYLGECKDTKLFVEKLRDVRRTSHFPSSMNVALREKEDQVDIYLDRGRIVRPLIVVKNGVSTFTKDLKQDYLKGKITTDDLIKKGIIEYIDAAEEENTLISLTEEELTEKHTHLEIDPSLILGVSASQLPFPEMNRGDRLNYGSRMILQASGTYLQNYLFLEDQFCTFQVH